MIIAATSNASGEVTVNHRYTSDQPVTGLARKGTATVFYKTGAYSGTIATGGLDASILLIQDE